jgi:hypothetical protein
MKKIMVIAACLLIISCSRLFAQDTQRELDHARSLIQRLMPEQAGFFSLAIIPRAGTQDVFEL